MSKILVVDDETNLRDLLYEILSKQNHEVFTAARGDQALNLLGQHKIDLALLDINNPGETGFSLLKKVRAKSPELPVVIFSGNSTLEFKREAFESGAVEVIQKGLSAPELIEKINKIIQAKQRLSGENVKRSVNEKILIVDDEENVRNLLVEFFSMKGFPTISARNGEEAIALVKSEKPAVILLDVMMPGMDGILTLKKIREFNKEVGVVMATAVEDEQIVQEAMKLGSYHYVLKPFDLQYLELVVTTRLVITS
jgi:two-component system, response regulator, stage 0 sporulation protein F